MYTAVLHPMHQIRIASVYGDELAFEEVPIAELAAALRRFHDQAITHSNSVIVLDGVVHTRNSFLEFVREFNECAARSARVAH
jgi:hypothetical protein